MRILENFATLFNFMSDPLRVLTDVAAAGAGVRRIDCGFKSFVFVFSPDAAETVLVKKADIFRQSQMVFSRIRPVTGTAGLVQLQGQASADARQLARPMFSSAAMANAQATIGRIVDDTIADLERGPCSSGQGAEILISELMTRLIMRTAMGIFLGIDDAALAERVGQKFLELNALCGKRMRSPLTLPAVLPLPDNRKISRLRREIRAELASELQRRGRGEGGSDGARRFDVPSVFQSDADVLDHCLTFLFAGHETTAASLSFTLLLLARFPAIQDVIARGESATALNAYKEALRLYPPAYMLAREATIATELEGVRVRPSDLVIVGLYAMHRNPQYFPEPTAYRPARFQDPITHPFAFVPFGAGPKSCLGERLAYVEAVLILKRMLKKFHIEPVAATIESEALITLHPRPGQKLRLRPREACEEEQENVVARY